MVVRGEKRKLWCWSDIPPELLEEILRKITFLDHLNCRRVCRPWRRIVEDAATTKACPPVPQFPFLMLLPPYPLDRTTFKYLYPTPDRYIGLPATLSDVTQEHTSPYTIPVQSWKGYLDFNHVFSVHGWLVLQNIYHDKNDNQSYDSIMFSNPLSGQEFHLPNLPLFQAGQDFTEGTEVKLVFSSAPPDSSDFLVVACATFKSSTTPRNRQQLAFCNVTDNKWTLIPTRQWFAEFLILDWKLYAMSLIFVPQYHDVTVFNLRDSNSVSFQKLQQHPVPRLGRGCLKHKLAKYGDELQLVIHDMNRWDSDEDTIGFRVFKLDISSSKWIQVKNFGDRVFLIDSAGIHVISAKEIQLPRNFSGGNCVFFLKNDICQQKCYLRVFSFKDNKITTFPLRHSFGNLYLRLLWFMPTR